MNCNETLSLLHAYADGELDLVRSLEVERHVNTCAGCAASAQSIHSVRSLFRDINLAYDAPPALRKRLRATFKQAATESRTTERRNWPWQILAFGATALAALLLLLRPAEMSESEQLANEAVSGHIRSLMPGHLTDVASSDQHTVKPWFEGKIDFAPDVKDFASEGFPLVGGRLDYLNGRPVAALVYRRNQHVINVFIWPEGNPVRQIDINRRGFLTLERNWKGEQYLFVSDLNGQELHQFAAMLTESRVDHVDLVK
jgi:anti-sigma factor RsiW